MTKAESAKLDAAKQRRKKELQTTIKRIEELQAERLHGFAKIHFQAGAIVRLTIESSEKIEG